MDESERYESGTHVRRSVLGDAHEDRAEASKDAADEEFQSNVAKEVYDEREMPR